MADKATARSNLDVPTNADLTTVSDSKVSKSGDVMTGTLAAPRVQLGFGHVDGDDTKSMIYNDQSTRNVVVRTGPSTSYQYYIFDPDGTLKLPRRPTWNYTPWDTGNFDPNYKLNRGGDSMWGRLTLDAPNWQADLGLSDRSPNGGSWTYIRARHGGGLDVINSAYNAIPFAIDDWGNVLLRGLHVMQTNGNLFCQYRNAWMSDILNDLYSRDDSKIDWGNANARWNNSWQVADHLFEARWDGRSINMFIDHTFVAYVASNASDMRLKTNIAPTQEDSLGKVNALAFKQFDWRSDGRQQSLGLIAQQAKTVDESFVHQSPGDRLDPSTCPMMLDTNALLLTALHAIQQLSAEVSALKAQLVPAA
ncbi:hypothetical protein WM15_30575 [Burkholderia ubonensis]|nr:hypothetical protein WM15_30575 [Burkholderia ubonensis]